jgi:HlyD family secretion protein
MKKLTWIIVLIVAAAAGGAVFYASRGDKAPQVTTLKVSRGDITDGVGATGTLQAVVTVSVGTQVSGIVQDLYADFNSIVKKGQVIARLDPSLMNTALETAQANLTNANANLERQKVAVQDALVKNNRAKELMVKQLETQQDLETADVTYKQAVAQQKSMESQVVQAQAAVDKAKVDLNHTIITAPIDGVVIKRSVDKGQTVNAGMSAPEIFIIAADLTKMQVNANIDESDVGQIRPGETVTFRVDAYPNDTFHGTVNQVRLNPTTVQNVVTYSTIIDVPNPDLKLDPGMTANLTIEIAKRADALRVPNAALRFRPTQDIFDALKQPMPQELQRGGRGGRRGGQNGQNAQTGQSNNPEMPQSGRPQQQGTQAKVNPQAGSAQAPATGSGQGRGGSPNSTFSRGGGDYSNMTPEERQKRRDDMLAKMTPEQRQQFEQRRQQFQAQGGGRGGFGGQQNGARGAATPQKSQTMIEKVAENNATTIDALFGPIAIPETRGRAWLYADGKLQLVSLRLGVTDGTYTEVLNDTALHEGQDVVTAIVVPDLAKPASSNNANGNPLMPQRRGGPGGRGGR